MNNFEILNVNQYISNHKNELNKEIGGLIKQIRIKKKIPIEEMATITNTSPAYISQIENGINGITLNKFIQICNSLKINSQEVLGNFLLYQKEDEFLFCEELQCEKSLSRNILEVMKKKKIVFN